MGIYAMIGIGLVMLTGWAGQVSLGQMAVAGVAGAAAGWFVTNFTDPVIGGTIVAMIIGGVAGAIVTAVDRHADAARTRTHVRGDVARVRAHRRRSIC